MSYRRAILLAALVVVLVAVPVAGAATDLYSNIGPGGSTSPAVDRYPLGNYVMDAHFSAIKASLTHVDATGVPAMIAYTLAEMLWEITAMCVNAMISLFALAFSVDLVNGSPATAGGGALAPVSDAIHNLYANTFGRPWMEIAVLLAGCWAMWRALVQRRYTETASALGMSLIFCLLAMAIVTKPDATIGSATRWNNEISAAFLSVTSKGEVTGAPVARRAAADQLFDTLIFRPWVALQFGGTEHCIRKGTGSKEHDPESVPVGPLADDPHADARARAQLHRTGHLVTATKECVDNTVRYPEHFLRYFPHSPDRDAAYDALNDADPGKVPDSDPTKNTYKPQIADKPATDAMEKGGQFQRLLLVLVILFGELGALLLLGNLCVAVLMASMMVLLLTAFSPVMLVAAIVPGRGHALFKNWAGQLATFLIRKAAYALMLAVLLAVLAALQGATTNLGWLLSFLIQSMLMWMVFLRRHQLAGQLISAVSGQQPERDTQLRKLLGVAGGTAYALHRWRQARRRNHATYVPPSHGTDDTSGGDPGDGDPADQPLGPDPEPSDRRHDRPPARRDHGGDRPVAGDTAEPIADDHLPRSGRAHARPASASTTDVEPGVDRRHGDTSPADGRPRASVPARRPASYTKTEAELYRNAEGYEVWRITDADGSLIAEDLASDREMTWQRDFYEHLHLGDQTATATADRFKDQDEADALAPSRPSGPSRDRSYTRTEAELYRNAEGHEVWRITDADDATVIAEDVSSDHDMQWLRDYHEHLHLGDAEATSIADRLEDDSSEPQA
jgi:hypothetical protein